jgi:hypothetical protein
VTKKKAEGHEIQTLNLREQKKRDQYRELRTEFEEGKITWEYFYEKAQKLFITKKSKTKKENE